MMQPLETNATPAPNTIWRLGLDLGTNSIGWWALRLTREAGDRSRWQVAESLDGGVSIFPDGREPTKSGRVGDSLAVARRDARGMRRNRDRGRHRFAKLVAELIDFGLLPADAQSRDALFQTPAKNVGDPECNNPYRLRSEALERPLTGHELGRVLAHLGRRRGFKSNRQEASEEDGGKLKERMDALRQRLGDRTLGQFLWQKFQAERLREQSGERRRPIRFKAADEFYPERAMYAEEFDAIRTRQQPHHALTDRTPASPRRADTRPQAAAPSPRRYQ